jgi:dolichyl-phosphate-mannose--protein O-mannosyl transferase
MNRKKKINQSLKKRVKKTNAKLHTSNKPKYVSKAERAKISAESDNDNGDSKDSKINL